MWYYALGTEVKGIMPWTTKELHQFYGWDWFKSMVRVFVQENSRAGCPSLFQRCLGARVVAPLWQAPKIQGRTKGPTLLHCERPALIFRGRELPLWKISSISEDTCWVLVPDNDQLNTLQNLGQVFTQKKSTQLEGYFAKPTHTNLEQEMALQSTGPQNNKENFCLGQCKTSHLQWFKMPEHFQSQHQLPNSRPYLVQDQGRSKPRWQGRDWIISWWRKAL